MRQPGYYYAINKVKWNPPKNMNTHWTLINSWMATANGQKEQQLHHQVATLGYISQCWKTSPHQSTSRLSTQDTRNWYNENVVPTASVSCQTYLGVFTMASYMEYVLGERPGQPPDWPVASSPLNQSWLKPTFQMVLIKRFYHASGKGKQTTRQPIWRVPGMECNRARKWCFMIIFASPEPQQRT